MSTVKIYLIPQWVQDALKRKQLDISAVLDLSKLRDILSLEDLAGLVACQDFDDFLIGKNSIDISSNISYEWSVSATPSDEQYLEQQIMPLAKTPMIKDAVDSRLFSPLSTTTEDSFQPTSSVKPYAIVHLDDYKLGVVLNEHGLTRSNLSSYRFDLVRDLIKQLYVYESKTAVARSPLFSKYLELLAA